MKVSVIDDLTDEQKEDLQTRLEAKEIKDAADDPVEFKRQMIGVQEVVVTKEVALELAELGISPDDLIAMLLKQAGTSN